MYISYCAYKHTNRCTKILYAEYMQIYIYAVWIPVLPDRSFSDHWLTTSANWCRVGLFAATAWQLCDLHQPHPATSHLSFHHSCFGIWTRTTLFDFNFATASTYAWLLYPKSRRIDLEARMSEPSGTPQPSTTYLHLTFCWLLVANET